MGVAFLWPLLTLQQLHDANSKHYLSNIRLKPEWKVHKGRRGFILFLNLFLGMLFFVLKMKSLNNVQEVENFVHAQMLLFNWDILGLVKTRNLVLLRLHPLKISIPFNIEALHKEFKT